MSDDPISVWREALKDSNHPRHSTAWVLFTETMTAEKADKLLTRHKEMVIPWLVEILDTEPLYNEDSLGKGMAPVVAVGLLGRWQVLDVLPRLIEVVEENDWDNIFWGETLNTLRTLGAPAIEPLLELASRVDMDTRTTIVSVLADIAKGDDRALALTLKVLDEAKNEWDIRFIAENLLVLDPERGIPALEQRMKTRKLDRKLRSILDQYIESARAGTFGKQSFLPPDLRDLLSMMPLDEDDF
jgi:hypothetical protein